MSSKHQTDEKNTEQWSDFPSYEGIPVTRIGNQ